VSSLATGLLPNGTPVVVSGSHDENALGTRLRFSSAAIHPSITAIPSMTGRVKDNLGTINVRRLDGGELLYAVLGHDDKVSSVATGLLANGTPVVVSGSHDETVRIWRLENGERIGDPIRHGVMVMSVATGVMPDGSPVVVSGTSTGVFIWRLDNGQQIAALDGHREGVTTVATGVLPNGTFVVVSGSFDNTVRIWRLEEGGWLMSDPLRHDRWVMSVAIATLPNGTPVAVSGGWDATVRIWRLDDCQPIATIDERARIKTILPASDSLLLVVTSNGLIAHSLPIDDG
jgi:WD40 repeat protein